MAAAWAGGVAAVGGRSVVAGLGLGRGLVGRDGCVGRVGGGAMSAPGGLMAAGAGLRQGSGMGVVTTWPGGVAARAAATGPEVRLVVAGAGPGHAPSGRAVVVRIGGWRGVSGFGRAVVVAP